METIKEKAIKVWNDHKVPIIITGSIVGGFALSAFGRAKFIKGYKRGALNGFWVTLDWINETFPEMDARNAVMAYKKANPDKWKTVNW